MNEFHGRNYCHEFDLAQQAGHFFSMSRAKQSRRATNYEVFTGLGASDLSGAAIQALASARISMHHREPR
ncbi:hypothetical protein LPW26_11975 [Rhodopseudomonas sp. HC1]|uniref:hypothetical protein n=1 Tax=Rhodopseudomonas infernalis TaxID=2897386 RepID=UPI001EE86835|nr:hypothetical protein [Rhodopseudomonas infernalis]MCG6205360.1 hypothetical protein [Rhodopseudomonas infernalis]